MDDWPILVVIVLLLGSGAAGIAYAESQPSELAVFTAAAAPAARPAQNRFPFDPKITAAATKHGIDPLLLAALVKQESGFDPTVCSHAGACGLGQLMPLTAAELGVADRFDVEQNLDGAARYLAQQLQRFGRLDLALAAYNAGPGRVGRCSCIPEGEPSRYVPAVLSHYQNYK